MKKRLLAIGLLVSMLMTTLCGCGGGSSSEKNDAELVGNTYVSGFPIVKEKETLKVMAVQLTNHGDFDEMSFTTTYEEMTNIDIEWTLVEPESIESAVSLALATGNLPDVFCILDGRVPQSVFLKYISDGTFLKLNDLIDKYGENIKAMFEKYPNTYESSVVRNGEIYSLPRVKNMTDNHERFPHKFYIRKTWLDNLNLEVPTTTEEFNQVLSAFREGDPNGNGQKDEVPFAMSGISDAFFGNFGISFSTSRLAVDENGKVEYGYATEECKKGLIYLNRLLNQGNAVLFDSGTKIKSKIRSGIVGAFYATDKYLMAGDELGSEYIMISPLSANDGSTPTISVNGTTAPKAFMITKACKNPEAALRWVDYLYSAEGSVLVTYGGEGDKVTKNADGKYEMVKENASVDRYTYCPGHALPYLLDDAYSDLFAELPESEMTPRERQDKELNEEVNNVLRGKYEPVNEIGSLMRDQQAADIEDKYLDAIKKYATQMINKFAKGEENVETGWSSYISELEKKGLNELLAEYQRLYDNKNKK